MDFDNTGCECLCLLHSPLLLFSSLGIHSDLAAPCGVRGTFEVQVVEPGDLLQGAARLEMGSVRVLEILGLAVGGDGADLCEHIYFSDHL
jgi:hypothetical protein